MRIATIGRKPCAEGSTTANVIKNETGALNVNACRIAGPPWKWGTQTDIRGGAYNTNRPSDGHVLARNVESNPAGRWPANVVLVHRSGCRHEGTTTVPGYTINRWTDGAKPFGGGAGHEYASEQMPDESVAVWACQPGCAVDNHCSRECPNGLGIASRYFKHFQEQTMNELPQELWDYLTTMIAPPQECEPVLIIEADLSSVDFSTYEDASVHGLITMGNPEKHLKEIDRVLRPGAHLLVIGDDQEPTGHTGACAVEDFGYEIRDAIAILDTPGEFHYVAKASSKERNAGLPDFEQKTEVDRMFPKDGEDLEDLYEQISETVNERWLETWQEEGIPPTELSDDVAGRFVLRKIEDTKTHRNNHPTVKPIAVMQALLHDVPKEGPVVDPFMGSGTTGLACMRTGHDFIGIEQDAEYIKIADYRVRHWDRAVAAWNGADIESEAVIEEDDEPMSLGDLFGMD